LRRAFIHRTDQAVLHYPGVEIRPDEFEHALVGHPCRDPRHQTIVIDSVEKTFEVEVDNDAVAFGNIALRLGYRLVGGASRTEAVAVLGERWIPTLLQDLQQRLLDQSVDNTRYAEFPDPAIADAMGISGRKMIEALIAGENDPAKLARLALPE
jgi:hypothetical protein